MFYWLLLFPFKTPNKPGAGRIASKAKKEATFVKENVS